ncbi:hypothetical protein FACS189494_11160 [Spirochaetia bacterium]|nr:hypothetical protein FACS189494_11160 [Spirochaetia bacterium]
MAEKSFLDRIEDEVLVGVPASNRACQTCMFAHGKAPWADTPMKGNCMIYERDAGEDKPAEVCFDGADCEYYEKETA